MRRGTLHGRISIIEIIVLLEKEHCHAHNPDAVTARQFKEKK